MKGIWKLLFIISFALNFSFAQSPSGTKLLIIDYQVPTYFEYSLDLTLASKDSRLFLDCQSFFHEFILYNPIYEFDAAPPSELRVFTVSIDSQLCLPLAEHIVLERDNGNNICLIYNREENVIHLRPDESDCMEDGPYAFLSLKNFQ